MLHNDGLQSNKFADRLRNSGFCQLENYIEGLPDTASFYAFARAGVYTAHP